MRTKAPRLGGPEHMAGEEREDVKPVCYQYLKHRSGRTAAVTRWTFTDAERAAIARGEDLYMMIFLDREPHDLDLCVGSPLQILAPGSEPA